MRRTTEIDRRGGADAEAVEMQVDGILDLHTFQPRDVADLVGTYLDECAARGILDVRIIHGKGIGTLRRIVHAVLDRRGDVVRYRAAGDASGWGATIVRLARSREETG